MVLFGIEFSAAQTALLAGVALILLLCIVILKKLAGLSPAGERQVEQETAAAASPAQSAMQKSDAEEGELIAVITAAVACAMGKDVKEVKVASLRELPKREYAGRSPWSRAGRAEQLNRYI